MAAAAAAIVGTAAAAAAKERGAAAATAAAAVAVTAAAAAVRKTAQRPAQLGFTSFVAQCDNMPPGGTCSSCVMTTSWKFSCRWLQAGADAEFQLLQSGS